MSMQSDIQNSQPNVQGSFAKAFVKFAIDTGQACDDAIDDAITTLVSRIIERTPVGMPETWGAYWRSVRGVDSGRYQPGHARYNWQTTIGSEATSEISGEDPSGQIALRSAVGMLKGAGYTYYFTNTAPYAVELEYGYSGQAPQGMLRVSLLEWQAILDSAVRKNKV